MNSVNGLNMVNSAPINQILYRGLRTNCRAFFIFLVQDPFKIRWLPVWKESLPVKWAQCVLTGYVWAIHCRIDCEQQCNNNCKSIVNSLKSWNNCFDIFGFSAWCIQCLSCFFEFCVEKEVINIIRKTETCFNALGTGFKYFLGNQNNLSGRPIRAKQSDGPIGVFHTDRPMKTLENQPQ